MGVQWGTFTLLAAVALGLVGPQGRPPLDITPIPEIQGPGPQSPIVGQQVTTSGVVTADFVNTAQNGFFLQALVGDADEATSDGIWVFDGNRDVTVSRGQIVQVSGEANEYYDLTELVLDELSVIGQTEVPAPVPLGVPQDPTAAAIYLEAREGMRVSLPPMTTVGATNGYGEAYLVPEASGVTRVFRQDREGRRLGVLWPTDWFRAHHGDRFSGIVGPLTYSYGSFKVAIADDRPPEVTASDLQPEVAAPAGVGELTVASYNLENLFDPVDDPGKNDTEWTLSPERYAAAVGLRARSIRDTLGPPDILAVQEVENLRVLQDLSREPALAGASYEPRLIEGDDARGIDVGLLVNSAHWRVLSAGAAQVCTGFEPIEPKIPCAQPGGAPGYRLYSRPPLVVRLSQRVTGGRLTVIVNHFKSKSGGDAETTPTRIAMAEHNRLLVLGLKAEEPAVPVIVLGDLNDFEDSEPLNRLTAGNLLVNLHDRVPRGRDYSFIFNGVSQVLDHILVEPALAPGVTAFGPVHINTDFASPAPGDDLATARRAADHDPLLARIRLAALPTRWAIHLPLALDGWADIGGEQPLPTAPPTLPAATATPAPASPTVPAATTAPPPATLTPTPGVGGPPRTPLRIDRLFYDGDEPRTEGDEYVELTNVSDAPVTLTGWRLISVQGNQIYRFPAGFAMSAGQTCRVYTNQSHPEHCGLNWGHGGSGIWRNDGDKAELRDAADRLIDHRCYGDWAGDC